MNSSKPSVVLVVDCSGSMNGYIGLMDKHLRGLSSQVQNGEINCRLAITPFDDYLDRMTWDGSFSLYNKGGGTNLYGSCLQTLRELQTSLDASDKVMIIVVTDGQHGSSGGADAHRTPAEVNNEVTIAEDVLGWDFLFVGTNQNAEEVGNRLGIKPGKALSFANSNKGFEAMLATLGSVINKWSEGAISHTSEFFTTETRDAHAKLGAIVI